MKRVAALLSLCLTLQTASLFSEENWRSKFHEIKQDHFVRSAFTCKALDEQRKAATLRLFNALTSTQEAEQVIDEIEEACETGADV